MTLPRLLPPLLRRALPSVRASVRSSARSVLLAASVALPLALPGVPARAERYPEPSVYPVSWELKFQHGTPKRIVVDVPGMPHPEAYWYMTYTITNPGEKPVQFLPQFELMTDDGRIFRSDLAVPSEAFDKIKKAEGNKLLEPARKIEGNVNPGEDQARDGVAIWKEPMLRMGTFSVFCGGLAGEFVELKDKDGKPVKLKNEVTGEDEPVVLHKTLHLVFQVLGDEVRPGNDEVRAKSEKWVMR